MTAKNTPTYVKKRWTHYTNISEDAKDKIFLPFFTTKKKRTGLGLAIVNKIVVSHGGNIPVETS